jgi:type IV pilus assembly protein PilV
MPVRLPHLRAYVPRYQCGAFLLEALVAILIVSFGILGIVGLQAQAMKVTNDSQYRAESVYLATELMSQMWADDYKSLKANYDSAGGGAKYVTFKDKVKAQLAGAWVSDPDVVFDDANAPSAQSSYVTITIPFRMPGDTVTHQYVTSGVVGQNP